eukprot:COSAG01_NODE_69520_length_261_cov_0.635802_1_plen_47_part_01
MGYDDLLLTKRCKLMAASTQLRLHLVTSTSRCSIQQPPVRVRFDFNI